MKEYMKELRKLVGSRPIFQNGASVLILDDQNRLLLGLRSDNKCWGNAGGSIELGEKLEEAAAREMAEEFGITPNHLELFGVFSGPELYYQYPNGDEVYNVDTVFLCRDYSGTPKVDGEEMLICDFFALNALPEPISPPIVTIIDQLVKLYGPQ